jgi:hypothetical protein
VWGLALAVGLGLGCKRGGGPTASGLISGQQIAEGKASDLRLSPDGKFAAFLGDAAKPRMDGIPPQMLVGELHVVPLTGGKPRKVGDAVTNVPGGYLFAPDSRWLLYLQGYNPASQLGELYCLDLSDPSADPRSLGKGVSYMLGGPHGGQVAFVSNGVLKAGPLPQGPFRELSAEVQTADFTQDGKHLLYKRRLSAAGSLFLWSVDGEGAPVKLGDQVGDFLVAPDGSKVAFTQRSQGVASTYDLFMATAAAGWRSAQVAVGAGVFAFSPDGAWLGRTEGQRPELLGDLVVGPSDGKGGRKVGIQVSEFEFAPDSQAVAFLERYDISARSGSLTVAQLPDGKPAKVGFRVPNYAWSPDGRHVAFIARFFKPLYSIDLLLYPVGAEEAFKVHPGVFGYGFDPKGQVLFFRSGCVREGRSCELFKLALDEPQQPPTKILEGVYSFKSSEDGRRLLVTYARTDSKLYDVAAFNLESGERKTLGQHVQLPALFAAKGGAPIVFIAGEKGPAGVYLSTEVP